MVIATGRALLDPYRALKHAGLKTDMYYADLGAGTLGHFVFPAAEIVGPQGRVYGVDILKEVIDALQGKARMISMPNVFPVWGDMERLGGVRIESGTMDLVSFIGVSEHLIKSPLALKEAYRLLKPYGRLLVIDWSPGKGSVVVKNQDRIDPEQVKYKVLEHSFRLVDVFEAGLQHWGLVFERIA
jgi:ubiquinone/menaquinone biosynthesis C-methylase UbiE